MSICFYTVIAIIPLAGIGALDDADTDADVDEGSWLASRRLLEPSFSTGTKSLIVMQMVHLKTFKSLGHLTNEAQVMQLPVAKSLLPAGLPLLCLLGPCPYSEPPSPAAMSVSIIGPPAELCFFLLLNKDGNGLLTERECLGLWFFACCGAKSESEELESACTCTLLELDVARCLRRFVGVSRASAWRRLIRSGWSGGVDDGPPRGVGFQGGAILVAELGRLVVGYG